ncbi:hypothetical protein C8J56DRAFT_940752 [Mycena floridula]|nr:hypothetical protein C8J56DRAFT_940752 [Mycena floridula]
MPLPLSPPSAAIRFTTMAEKPRSLDSLAPEILGVIVDCLVLDAEQETEHPPLKPSRIGLKSLSRTHSFLHDVCFERLYRDFTWWHPWEEIPNAIAPYIIKFTLSLRRGTEEYNASRTVVVERLATILKQADKLVHFAVEVLSYTPDQSVDPGPELTAAISAASNLQTLQFAGFRWALPLPINPSWALPQSLTRFIYDRRCPPGRAVPEARWPRSWSGLPRHPKRDLKEAKSLFYLITANAGTLEELVLPAEMSLLGALGSVSWPRLRELTFFGFPPKFPCPPLNHLLISQTGLPALPLLQRLVIRIGRPLDWKEPRLWIFPPHDSPESPQHEYGLFPVFGSIEPDPDIQLPKFESISDDGEPDPESVPEATTVSVDSSSSVLAPTSPVTSATASPKPTKVEPGGMIAAKREDTNSPGLGNTAFPSRDVDGTEEKRLSISLGLVKTVESAAIPSTERLDAHNASDSLAVTVSQRANDDEREVETILETEDAVLLEPFIAGASVLPSVLPKLHSLVVSNPRVDDLFWEKVPECIKELTLLGYPHYSRPSPPVPSATSLIKQDAYTESLPAFELRSILSSISAISLTTLRLSFWESEDDFPFFDFVAKRYSSLHVLEIHRYGFEHNVSTIDLERICHSLAVLDNLEVLKLDLKFNESIEPARGEHTKEQWDTWLAKAEEANKLILNILPQLKLSALALFNPGGFFFWYKAWSVMEEDGSQGYRTNEPNPAEPRDEDLIREVEPRDEDLQLIEPKVFAV